MARYFAKGSGLLSFPVPDIWPLQMPAAILFPMAARAIGTATISFGLVSIPIKVFSSTVSESSVHFNLLHGKCGSRVKQQYICPTDNNEIVPRSDMVKGYEFSKGQYVTFTSQELKAFEEEANRALEIAEFVPESKIDSIYFSKAYYLGPDKGGERAYALLRAAMRETGRVALAKYAVRGKQYIVMVRPMEDGLVMQQLHYADEVRSIDEVETGDAEVKPGELQLAVQIIEQIASDEFKPDQYEDTVRKRILEAVQIKVDGQEIQVMPSETPKAQIIDLMDALRASLGEGEGDAERKPAKSAGSQDGSDDKEKVAK